MYRKLIFTIVISQLIFVLISGCSKPDKHAIQAFDFPNEINGIYSKPYRVLVIIGDQWTDPMSYHIDPSRVEGTDFLDVVNMLKIWGVPFDVLRLDEQRLQIPLKNTWRHK